jgi:hypothetical protein
MREEETRSAVLEVIFELKCNVQRALQQLRVEH